MPVILATQEVEIRRNTVQSQPGQIVPETLSQILGVGAEKIKFLTHKKRGLEEWLKL
jgi:hypothetical protein